MKLEILHIKSSVLQIRRNNRDNLGIFFLKKCDMTSQYNSLNETVPTVSLFFRENKT